MKRIIMCAAICASVAAGAAGAASAEDGKMRVNLSDLNLDSVAGAQVALARIRYGAGVFCDANAGRQSLERVSLEGRCVTDMTKRGVDQLHAPVVTALLEGKAVADKPVALAEK